MRVAFLKEDLIQTASNSSTYGLFHEAQMRGAELYHFRPSDIALDGANVFAHARRTVFNDDHIHFTQGDSEYISLDTMDVVLLRLDPPFDGSYYMALAILEHLDPSVLTVNKPYAVKNFIEKLYPFDLTEHTPKTVIASSVETIRNFVHSVPRAVLKPIHTCGGAGVFFTDSSDVNLDTTIETLLDMYELPIVAQEFLDVATYGDKRIVMIDGDPVGCYVRMPQGSSLRANLASGGGPIQSELTDKDLEICAALKAELKGRGIFLCGIDVIKDKLTEINVTNPAFGGLNQTGDVNVARIFWDKVISHKAK